MESMSDTVDPAEGNDGIDRRGFLRCMAWAGTGMLWTVSGGILSSRALGQTPAAENRALNFIQISDSHIGFDRVANKDVVGTFQAVVAKINALPAPPAFILHTGDLTQMGEPGQFDTVTEILKGAKTTTGKVFTVPGEHDVMEDGGKRYLERYGKGTRGGGWYSFDQNGVHFIGLVNVLTLSTNAMGSLGAEQLAWLEQDIDGLSDSTPIVVFAHMPLWEVYPEWGWGTVDAAAALALLKRFGSVTVLNGHIHQIQQKIEGRVTFHTAMSTAFPQPAPGAAPTPGPMAVPAGDLRSLLGITRVEYVSGRHSLALVDTPLAAK